MKNVEVTIMRRCRTMLTGGVALLLAACTVTAAHADATQANLRNDLGITYAKEGHFEDALRSFSLVLAEMPEHAAALNNAANIYFVQGATDRARTLYERAIAAQPDEGGIHLNLGILQHASGDDAASAASVRHGLELIGDPHEAYYMLGLSSQRPSSNERAADASDLKASEIEELLARAMADIPAAAKEGTPEATANKNAETASTSGTTTPASPAATQAAVPTVSTRPGGAKASDASETGANIVADRLFWMSATKSP